MKKNNAFLYLACIPLLLGPALLSAQSFPTLTTHSNFKCEVYLEIYNGLYDWHGGNDYSGGSAPLSDGKKTTPGAATVANKNDTDGDGTIDRNDFDVRNGASTLGRNEVDLIKIVVKKVNPAAMLTGDVVLKVNSGSVKLWTNPWKGTEVALPHTISAAALDKTFYLEALEASDYRGIEIEVTYGGKSDKAFATAVWVTRELYWRANTTEPVPGASGTLPTLDEDRLVESLNERWISMDDTRYGHGEFNRGIWGTDNGMYDKRFGGRILLQFKVSPVDAAKVVRFDVTRQRKTRTARNYYAGLPYFYPDMMQNKDFPDDPTVNMDNELPNDDSTGVDEDNRPNLSFIYSADPPATVKRGATDMPPGEIENTVAFKVSKNSFREFVRVQLKSREFPYTAQYQLLGSRASDRYEWHCTYYTKRFNEPATLVGDYDVVSSSIPLKFNAAHTGNGTATVSVSGAAMTDVFFLLHDATQSQWFLSNWDASQNGSSGPPAADGSWTVTAAGVTVLIKPGSVPFQDSFTWVFNTFRTAAPSGTKINEININAIDPTTDQ